MESRLLTPVSIRSLHLPNRVVFPPITMNYAEAGRVSERDTAFHVQRALGGCGLNMLDGALVETAARSFRLALDDDGDVPPLTRLADAVHLAGGRIGVQLLHHGRAVPPGLDISRRRLVSVVPDLTPDSPELVMDGGDIREVIRAFAAAAGRAQKSGMDMVELQGAHGYLIAQFMSPLTNTRTDGYGGSFENRMRFPLELLEAVRSVLGPEYPISVRLNVEELVPGGLTLEDTQTIAGLLVENGVDLISLSASVRESYQYMMPPAHVAPAWLAEKSGAVRRHIREMVPVMVSGRIVSCAVAEDILARGLADLAGIGRAQIADPRLVAKYSAGREKDTVPCLGCNVGCGDNLDRHRPICCAVNPLAGNERLYPGEKSGAPRRIVVVGGGPAGMQAAITAAERGHSVTLIEKNSELGARLDLVARPPFKSAYAALKNNLAARMSEAGVDVRLGLEADADCIRTLGPQAVILATGSVPLIPRFCENATAVTAEEALRGQCPGRNVLVLGGGAVGAETAEFLAENGRAVTIVELRDAIAPDMEWRSRFFLHRRLEELGVTLCLNTRIIEIDGKKVNVATPDGQERWLENFDSLVLSMGYKPYEPLGRELESLGVSVHRVGDCENVGLVLSAIHSAFALAYHL